MNPIGWPRRAPTRIAANRFFIWSVSGTLALGGGTAIPSEDCVAASGTVTITPGQTDASFPIDILDDNLVNEPSAATVNVTLSNPTNAVLGAVTSQNVTINEDNDGSNANLPPSAVAGNSCNCGCPGQEGSLVQPASASIGPAIKDSTANPVRYEAGVATLATTDLHASGFGFDWGQTRTWTNGRGYATGSDNGSGWVDTYIPHLIQADGSTNNTLILITNGDTAYC